MGLEAARNECAGGILASEYMVSLAKSENVSQDLPTVPRQLGRLTSAGSVGLCAA